MLNKMTIRFFIWDEKAIDELHGIAGDIVEVDEEAFLACPYPISYERHTVRENGVSQVCLTKQPNF